MDSNFVKLTGTVKRDSSAMEIRSNFNVLDFCLVTPTVDAEDVFVDCFAFGAVCDELEGKVFAGERLTVTGTLTYRTYTTCFGKKKTGIVVNVDSVYEED